MSDAMRTGLPDDLGVVRADGEILVYELAEGDTVSLTRFGEGHPIPPEHQTSVMLQAVEADLVKRGLMQGTDRKY